MFNLIQNFFSSNIKDILIQSISGIMVAIIMALLLLITSKFFGFFKILIKIPILKWIMVNLNILLNIIKSCIFKLIYSIFDKEISEIFNKKLLNYDNNKIKELDLLIQRLKKLSGLKSIHNSGNSYSRYNNTSIVGPFHDFAEDLKQIYDKQYLYDKIGCKSRYTIKNICTNTIVDEKIDGEEARQCADLNWRDTGQKHSVIDNDTSKIFHDTASARDEDYLKTVNERYNL